MKHVVVGWDVGGANIKMASADGEDPGSGPDVIERPFMLWREPDRLAEILGEMASVWMDSASVSRMGVTMTAELADCFATKREGVGRVLDAFSRAFPTTPVRVYGVDGRFRSVESARDEPLAVAAANWMASATLAGRFVPDALFLDIGSTTTDIIPIVSGQVAARGRSDAERLASGELIYTGALRTPVCAVVHAVPIAGHWVRVAAEHFAITADVHLWLGNISGSGYTCETPDGRGRSRTESGARLARMVCMDFETLGEAGVHGIARQVADAQVRQVVEGIRQVQTTLGSDRDPSEAVIAGHGAFLAEKAAEVVGLAIRHKAFDRARLSPAAAVACLLAERR